MRITFVTPHAGMSGGIRIVVTYARIFQEAGHDVTIVSTPFIPRPKSRADKLLIRTGLKRSYPKVPCTPLLEAFGGKHIEIESERSITASDVPDADLIFATWWETAEWVEKMPPEKGRKAYLIQDYEIFTNTPTERVTATYSLDMRKIAVSQYIRKKVEACTPKGQTVAVVPNAIDTVQFSAPVREKSINPTVGFLYTTKERKNVKLAISALEMAKLDIPNLRALSFGNMAPADHLPLPSWVEYHQSPSQDTIPRLYAGCDVWLLTSLHEGFGLPLLEAMACRTPVLSTDAGAASDLITGHNGRLLSHDASAFAEVIADIAAISPAQWRTMSDAAYATAQEHNWADAADRLLKAAMADCVTP